MCFDALVFSIVQNQDIVFSFCRYGIEQISPKVIFTSQHLVPKLQQILSTFPNGIEFVVYFENSLKKNAVFEENESANITPSLVPLSKIEDNGSKALDRKEKGSGR